MIRAGIAATLLLLSASSAFADIPRPQPRDVCKTGRNVVQCSAQQGRGYTQVNIRTCSDGKKYGLIYSPGPTDAPVEKARFSVSQAAQPRGLMGAPVTWKGTNFSLKINYTTAPRPDRAHPGALVAKKSGLSWNKTVSCK